MNDISAARILKAIASGDLEAIGDDGVITLLVDRIEILRITEAPSPRVEKGPDLIVTILSGDVPLAKIPCETDADADKIVSSLSALLIVV